MASAAAGLVLSVCLPLMAADEVAQVIETLRRSRSLKLRIHAASVLARMNDRRVVSELGRTALSDRSPAVLRLYALKLLGQGPGGERDGAGARAVLRQALRDRRSDVRGQAARSLAELDGRGRSQGRNDASSDARARAPAGPMVLAVGAISDRTGRARPQLRAQMRSLLVANLRRQSDVSVLEAMSSGGAGRPAPSYVIDGSIARLDLSQVGRDVETACAVQLVVSRPPRGIVMVASGEASVLKPQRQYRPAMRESTELEALDHAIASAFENLSRFLSHAR